MKTFEKRLSYITILTIIVFLFVTYSCKDEAIDAEYKVTIISNGGTNIAPVFVKGGEQIPANKLYPNPIVNDGGTFITWCIDPGLQTEFDFKTPVTEDMTLYAKWFYKTFAISFVMNGADSKADIQVIEGRYLVLANPTYAGFVFVNWYENSEMTKLANLKDPIIANKTLYAKWLAPSPSSWFSIDGAGTLTSCNPPAGTTIVVIPEGVKAIPAWFILANGLNAPGKPGFPTGKNIKEFILPESLETIGMGAFKFAGITTIKIPSKVKVLESVVFQGCSQLTSFTFASNSELEKVASTDGNDPVIEATALESIIFPASLKYVGKYTLAGCTALKIVTFERTESPVIFYTYLSGGGVWLFGGYFPVKIRVPNNIKGSFTAEMRKVMADYEYGKMSGITEGY